jgi:hypothetical protein
MGHSVRCRTLATDLRWIATARVCNGASTSATVTFSNTTQINIALPTSSVSRSCVAYSSSTNSQFIQFNFTTPPD